MIDETGRLKVGPEGIAAFYANLPRLLSPSFALPVGSVVASEGRAYMKVETVNRVVWIRTGTTASIPGQQLDVMIRDGSVRILRIGKGPA